MWIWIRPAVKFAEVETAKIAFCYVMGVMQGKKYLTIYERGPIILFTLMLVHTVAFLLK